MRLALALLLAAGAAEAQDVDCATEDGRAFSLALDPLLCVEAGDTAAPTACAPSGGWGLVGADGEATLATDAAGLAHDGLWLFAHRGPTLLTMSASHGRSPPLALEVAGNTFWRLRLSLADGTGSMWTAEGEAPVACEGL